MVGATMRRRRQNRRGGQQHAGSTVYYVVESTGGPAQTGSASCVDIREGISIPNDTESVCRLTLNNFWMSCRLSESEFPAGIDMAVQSTLVAVCARYGAAQSGAGLGAVEQLDSVERERLIRLLYRVGDILLLCRFKVFFRTWNLLFLFVCAS